MCLMKLRGFSRRKYAAHISPSYMRLKAKPFILSTFGIIEASVAAMLYANTLSSLKRNMDYKGYRLFLFIMLL